jgi:hypothetical protein
MPDRRDAAIARGEANFRLQVISTIVLLHGRFEAMHSGRSRG